MMSEEALHVRLYAVEHGHGIPGSKLFSSFSFTPEWICELFVTPIMRSTHETWQPLSKC
jgi:hypothetical protein